MNKDIIKDYKNYLKQFRKNKYLLNVFKSFAVVYLHRNFDKVSIDFKKEYFRGYSNHELNNSLLEFLYPDDCEIPPRDLKKALNIVKEYLNNFKRYA